jgi:hypothetical protein
MKERVIYMNFATLKTSGKVGIGINNAGDPIIVSYLNPSEFNQFNENTIKLLVSNEVLKTKIQSEIYSEFQLGNRSKALMFIDEGLESVYFEIRISSISEQFKPVLTKGFIKKGNRFNDFQKAYEEKGYVLYYLKCEAAGAMVAIDFLPKINNSVTIEFELFNSL